MNDTKTTQFDEVIDQAMSVWSLRYLRHGLIWFGLFALVVLLNYRSDAPLYTILNSIIFLAFHYLIIKINFDHLIPRYLNKKRVVRYLLAAGAVAMILAPLRSLTALVTVKTFAPQIKHNFTQGAFMVFGSLIIVVLISTVVRVFSDWMKYNRVKAEMSKQQMTSELNFLRSQVNPHFLFNTLNSLYALTLKKSDQAPEIVIKLSEMMRYMLYECNEAFVSLNKEIKYLQNYIELERLRHGAHIDITFDLEGEPNDHQVAPLLFVPFIENSFKHGLGNRIDSGFVHINMKIMDKELSFGVTNSKNHNRTVVSNDKTSGGIGLVNVRRRLNLIYPDQHDLLISDHIDTFTISLVINLHST